MKKHFSIAILFFFCFLTKAQFNSGYVLKNDVPVLQNGDTLTNPWAGGLNNPVFSPVDINLDGYNDIFVFERDGKKRKAFVYQPNSGIYKWDSVAFSRFPETEGGFTLLRDFNGDGKMDVILHPTSAYGFTIYLNTSDTNLAFTLERNALSYSRKNQSFAIFALPYNELPAIDDMDGDGDIDIIYQTSGGALQNSNVLFYIQNMGVEKYGTADSIEYALKNECWGSVSEAIVDPGWSAIDCSDTTGLKPGRSGERHGSTTLTSLDINGDGNNDLLIGDSYIGTMAAFFGDSHNIETTVDLSIVDSTFPSYNTPINTPSNAAAYYFDINQDGAKDLIAAPYQPTYSQTELDTSINQNVDWLYLNKGTSTEPLFELEKKGFLGGDMIDVGSRSFPTLVDLNGDGLKDLVVGNEGFRIYGGESSAYISYYKNVGTSTAPVYELTNSNLGNARAYGFGYAHPTFTDLDDDGDQDMMVGDDQGMLHYFRNIGSASFPQLLLVEPEFSGIDVDLAAHPQFFDLSTDGIPDLIIGDKYGRIQYFENSGTASSPNFSPNPSIEKLGGLLLYNAFGGEATPYFTRSTDNTGATYAFVGTAEGTILAYGPINNIFAPLVAIDSIELEAAYTSITGANLSGDLRDELIIGQRSGGLFYMRRDQDVKLGIGENNLSESNPLMVFPNPTNQFITVQLRVSSNQSSAEIQLTDISGKTIMQQAIRANNSHFQTQLNLSELPQGVYFIKMRTEDRNYWSKVIKK
jgi:hypothetical protein